MRRYSITLLLVIVAGSAFAILRGRPAEYSGAKVENFALFDNQGGFFELWRKKYLKGVVLISHGCECPMMRKQIPYIEALRAKYSAQGIEFFYINPQDSFADIKEEAKNFGITIPILLDDAQIISQGLNFSRTLEAILIETGTWKTAYRGSINDQLSFDGDRSVPQNEFLAKAIDDLLAGRLIRKMSSELDGGCALSYRPVREVTYQKEIRPILENNCVSCHSSGGVPPTKMGNFAEAKRWSAMIREVIRTNRMPPGMVDPNFGPHPKNHLPSEHRAALVRWVESGMIEGARGPAGAASASKPPKPMREDLRFPVKEVQIPASGKYLNALYPISETLNEDLWIQRLRLDIADPAQVHHAHLLVLPAEYARSQKSGMDADSAAAKEYAFRYGINLGFNPGPSIKKPMLFAKSSAIKIPKGSRLMLDVHHATTGKPEIFKPAVVVERIDCGKSYTPLHFSIMYKHDLRIPASTPNFHAELEEQVKQNIRIDRVSFHMHKRGRGMRLRFMPPNGEIQPVYSVPNYKFTQQPSYALIPPSSVSEGSLLLLDADYDNSNGNPAIDNSDHEIPVGVDTESAEMMRMTYSYTIDNEPPFIQKCVR